MSLLPHLQTERQQSIKKCWSCILGNEGITRIFEVITEPSTTIVLQNTTHNTKNIDSKIMDTPTCNVFKQWSLDVKRVILIKYNHQTAKAGALYESTDGPARQPTDNPPNSDWLVNLPQTVPGKTIRVNWQPGSAIWKRFSSHLDLDPWWQSGTVANTTARHVVGAPRWSQMSLKATALV